MIEPTSHHLWLLIAVAVAWVAAAFMLAGLALDLSHSLASGALLVLTAAAVSLRGRVAEPRGRMMVDAIELFGAFMAVSALGALGSYAVAAGSTGYADAWLAAADRALRFDWPRAYRFVAARPLLSHVAELAYLSIFASPFVVLAALAFTHRAARARRFVVTMAVALGLTMMVFHFFPARSALAHHVGLHPAYVPATGLGHVAIIEGLRDGSLTRIDPAALSGLVTFPSFHVAAALLFVWAGWPVRLLRVPLVAVNAAMIAATPVEGTHYLVDVLGGAMVAAASVGLVRLALAQPWSRRKHFGDSVPA